MGEEGGVEARAQRRVGTVVCGKYTVERVLGVGGMAVVFAATHRNKKRVAIKMLHPELSVHSEIRQRFLREGYVANSVNHRGAVDVIDDDVTEDGAAFLVMEFLEGETLDSISSAYDRIPVDAAVAIGCELCEVLASAHAAGIVHRDIKPANLFVTKEGVLKVLDFGIARLRDASGHATGTGILLGTPAFMAPEQAKGLTDEISAATDIFAVGATLFNLLTGTTVRDAETPQLMVLAAASEPVRPIRDGLPSLDEHVGAVIDRALSMDRHRRWATSAEMREALHKAYRPVHGELPARQLLADLVSDMSKRPRKGSATSKSGSALASTLVDRSKEDQSDGPRTATRPAGTTDAGVARSLAVAMDGRKKAGLALLTVAVAGGLLYLGVSTMLQPDTRSPVLSLSAGSVVQASAPTSPAADASVAAQAVRVEESSSASAMPSFVVPAPPRPTEASRTPRTATPAKTIVAATGTPPAPRPSVPVVDPGSVR